LSSDVVRTGDRLRPRICGQKSQTASHAALRLDLQSVVDGVADRFVGTNVALVYLVRPAGIEGSQTRRARIDNVDRPIEVLEGDDEAGALGARVSLNETQL